MKLYLAGPMSGKPEFNWPEFKRVTKLLRDQGYNVTCPTESGATHETPYHECLKADLKTMLEADSIAFLPGWYQSRGATFEALVAKILGYQFYSLEILQGTILPVHVNIETIIQLLLTAHLGLGVFLDAHWVGTYKDIVEPIIDK